MGSQPSTLKRAKDKEESSMALAPEMTPQTTLIEKISMEMRQLTERYLYILHNRPKEFVFLPVAGWPQWPQFGADQHGGEPGASEELGVCAVGVISVTRTANARRTRSYCMA